MLKLSPLPPGRSEVPAEVAGAASPRAAELKKKPLFWLPQSLTGELLPGGMGEFCRVNSVLGAPWHLLSAVL